MRILLVEDDEIMIETLSGFLVDQHYVVDTAPDGQTGWDLIQTYPYDLVLLDIMLPKLDGISLCRQLREQQYPVLVMLLTARDNTTDKILGLDSGADDYVVKPVNLPEIAARIRALLRRGTISIPSILTCGALQLDLNSHEVSYQGQLLHFSRTEYLLLELFLRHQHRIYSCRDIVEHLWAFDADPPDDTTVRSHIKNIRRELNGAGAKGFLKTVYGQGYRVNPDYLAMAPSVPDLPDTRQEQLDRSIAEIWPRTQRLSGDRLRELYHIVQALKSGTFTPQLHQQAIQTTHKLMGSLGMFGLERGSTLARQLESLLRAHPGDPPHPLSLQEQQALLQGLDPLMAELWQEVNGVGMDGPHGVKMDAKRVLVIDDEDDIREVAKISLELIAGFEVILASTGQEGLIKAELERPDAILLDVMLSDMDGVEAFQQLQANPMTQAIPVVLLTAKVQPSDQQRFAELGVKALIAKPFKPAQLAEQLIQSLGW